MKDIWGNSDQKITDFIKSHQFSKWRILVNPKEDKFTLEKKKGQVPSNWTCKSQKKKKKQFLKPGRKNGNYIQRNINSKF